MKVRAMDGSDQEPLVPLPHEADEQMRAATDRLRHKAWMVAPMTTVLPDPPLIDAEQWLPRLDSNQ